MENKAVKYTFQGMNRDVSEGKHPTEFFYEANNIRFLTTDEVITGGIAFEKGNELKVSLPNIEIRNGLSTIVMGNGQNLKYKSGNEIDTQLATGLLNNFSENQVIIGHTATRDSIILFSTDDNNMDCIWEVNMSNYDIKLLYLRNLNLSKESPIQAVFNHENENIQKVYWVDGNNQIRFINIKHSVANGALEELINVNSNTINFVGNFKISQPEITDVVSGGNHTAGMIQYAYNLYRLNASQTKLSPFSELVSLGKGVNLGGGEVNEIVGSSPVISIQNMDPEYTHVKVYAIKYTSFNQTPSISLIEDKEIPSSRSINLFDDGNIKEELSLAQLLFLGSDPIIPQHIETKDNIMFSANIKEKIFDVDIDTRAYSFPKLSAETSVYDNPQLKAKSITTVADIDPPLIPDPNYTGHRDMDNWEEHMIPDPDWEAPTITENVQSVIGEEYKIRTADFFNLTAKHDAVNLDYSTNRYQANSEVLGGEGKYIKYEIVQDETITDSENYKFYKDNEVYRFGIHFYNRLGQTTLPKWLADYRMPEGNLEGKYNTLKITLKPEFYVWLNDSSNFKSEDDKPVGYKILRANRTLNDKTIIAQGFLNGMMSNMQSDGSAAGGTEEARNEAIKGVKLPSLQRVYGKHHKQMEPMEHYKRLSNSGEDLTGSEVATSKGSDGMIANTWQFNSIIQMYSPDIMFSNISTYEGLNLTIKGANLNKSDNFWGQERKLETKEIVREGKVLNGLTPYDSNAGTNIVGPVTDLTDTGIFGPSVRDSKGEEVEAMDFYHFYRDFTEEFIKSDNKVVEQIFGKPQINETGQGHTSYNGYAEYGYYNTLQPMLTDNIDSKALGNTPGLTSVNSWGSKSMTIILGAKELDIKNRTTLEKLYQRTGITDTNVMLVGELIKNDVQVYLGGIYGGNSFEDKKRTKYIEIGKYNNLNVTSTIIKSGGDTFVQKFRFAKIVKTDTEVYKGTSTQITEIVEGWVETDIDLKNRHDGSLSSWDSKFQPKYEDYHKYNRVYSQQPTIKQETELDYNMRVVKNYDTRIMASKVKIPGEYIDNWTDILVNESLDLNGKHGKINALVSFKDNLFAFQDNAFAMLGINPRVQVQGGDGVAIELGSGGVLHDYNYVSTTSGAINKWGVIPTTNGIYYLDALNRAILRFTGESLEGLSATRGLHKYLVDNLDINKLKIDNPLLNAGVSMGYDLLNSDVYLTHNNGDEVWTLCFNEKLDQFTGFYDYHAPIYIYTKEKLLTLNPSDATQLYETHAGEYNIFYEENKLSNLIFIANPEMDHECIFNNLEYKSVALDAVRQEQRYTWEHVRIYNEFQDSELRALEPNNNIRKLNRKYRISLPRNKNSTDRIRNNWAFIELRSLNAQKLFYMNQDIILYYRPNYISIQ